MTTGNIIALIKALSKIKPGSVTGEMLSQELKNKIDGIDITDTEYLPVYSVPNPPEGWQVNWLFDHGWYLGGIKKDCGGHPPVFNDNHNSWAILVLNGQAVSGGYNHRLQIAWDIVNSKCYMRRGWQSENTWADEWSEVGAADNITQLGISNQNGAWPNWLIETGIYRIISWANGSAASLPPTAEENDPEGLWLVVTLPGADKYGEVTPTAHAKTQYAIRTDNRAVYTRSAPGYMGSGSMGGTATEWNEVMPGVTGEISDGSVTKEKLGEDVLEAFQFIDQSLIDLVRAKDELYGKIEPLLHPIHQYWDFSQGSKSGWHTVKGICDVQTLGGLGSVLWLRADGFCGAYSYVNNVSNFIDGRTYRVKIRACGNYPGGSNIPIGIELWKKQAEWNNSNVVYQTTATANNDANGFSDIDVSFTFRSADFADGDGSVYICVFCNSGVSGSNLFVQSVEFYDDSDVIGPLSELDTDNKASIVEAINELAAKSGGSGSIDGGSVASDAEADDMLNDVFNGDNPVNE